MTPPYIVQKIIESIQNGQHTVSTAAKEKWGSGKKYRVSRQTIYKWLEKHNVEFEKHVSKKTSMLGNKRAVKSLPRAQ